MLTRGIDMDTARLPRRREGECTATYGVGTEGGDSTTVTALFS
jgi:hypothetical protein